MGITSKAVSNPHQCLGQLPIYIHFNDNNIKNRIKQEFRNPGSHVYD